MASPVLNGILASSSGVAAEQRAIPAAGDDLADGAFLGLGSLGIGLVVALLILAYWYRRVL